MSYDKKRIVDVIKEIDGSKIYLPALQRKFVWEKHQIELLFDSLMRNYPFGTFLFWKLQRKKAENYVFYDFLKEYDERSPYNRRKTGAFLHDEIIGVLDGQQRLSSMYIGLMGTHTEKTKRKHSANPNAYEKTCLYVNLLSLPYTIDVHDKIITQEDQNFEFRFLTNEKASSSITRKIETSDVEEPMLWFKVGDVLSWEDEPEFDHIVEKYIEKSQNEIQKVNILRNKRLIKRGLETLHKRIRRDELINFFQVEKGDLEDILKIFVRVNSGATILSTTDLLFSTIVATWDDGREQIETLQKKINEKGDGFNFDNEYLMRCCLVLTDGPVLFKVKSFKSENVEFIRNQWTKIAEAIEKTVDLLVEFGFSGSVLASKNATILIAYYIFKGGDQSKESKDGIRKYLIHALLNGIFGGSQDQVISTLRNDFREEVKNDAGSINYIGRHKKFSFADVLKIELPQKKSLAVSEADIEGFLQLKKGSSTFMLLSLLYPHLRYNDTIFHQDHIHPAAGFTKAFFERNNIRDEEMKKWLELRDCVPNLQLMNGPQNSSKNDTPLKKWLESKDPAYLTNFRMENYFPDGIDLEFENFMQFFENRKQKLKEELKKVLAISNQPLLEHSELWSDQNDEAGGSHY